MYTIREATMLDKCWPYIVGGGLLLLLSLLFYTIVLYPSTYTPEEVRASRVARGEYLASEVSYFYDTRTGLCFAQWGGSDGGIALVPYEKVEHILLNPPAEPPE